MKMSNIVAWMRALTAALLGPLFASLLAASVLAAAGDDLARSIERGIEEAKLQLRVEPERALANVSDLRRQLSDLEQTAPEHLRLPQLQREVGRLEDRLRQPEGAAVVASPPETVEQRLEGMRARLQEAESRAFSGETERAREMVQDVEKSLEELRQSSEEVIPKGHVSLFVLEERIAALKRQLNE